MHSMMEGGQVSAVEGDTAVQPGAVLDDYNADLVHNVREQGDLQEAEEWYELLRRPLQVRQNKRGQPMGSTT